MDADTGGFRLAPPTVARDMLTRPRLLSALLDRFRSRVTLLSAGPGFGKTSLLGQAYTENLMSPRGVDVWLTCHPGDAVTSTLGQGLAAALGLPTPATLDPDGVARILSAEVWRRAPDHVAIILDDAHLIPPDSPGAALLAAIVNRLPSNGHLLLAGRMPLPMNTARLAARGELTELFEDDLGFSTNELSAFAALRGVPDELLSEVAPWPALAELTATTGQRRVTDFVWEELLADMSAERLRKLAVLAAVGGADDEIYALLFGEPAANQGADLSSVLYGLPLVNGVPGSWRSLHALWDAALSRELSVAEIADARTTVAGALLARGRVEDAMRHYLAAQSWDGVATVICEVAKQTHPLVAPDVLAQWHSVLPQDRRDRAEGVLLMALIERGRDLAAALRMFVVCAEALRAEGNTIGEFSALTHVVHISWWTDDAPGLEAAVQRLTELGTVNPLLRARALLGQVLLADIHGEFDRAWAMLAMAPAVVEGRQMAAMVGWLRAWVLLMLGDPHRALPHAEVAATQAVGTFRATGLNVLLLARWWSGLVDEAIAGLPAFVEASDATGRALGRVFERAQCAALLAFAGDVDAAEEHLRVAREALPGAEGATMAATTTYTLADAAVAVARGQENRARTRLAAEMRRHPPDQPGAARMHRLFPALSYVLVPASRSFWDRAQLGPATRQACEIARALVAVRHGKRLDAESLAALPAIGTIRAMLPLPWAVELAVGVAAADSSEATAMLNELGLAARPWLKALVSARGPLATTARELLSSLPAPPRHRLELRLLGPCELFRDGELVNDRDLGRQRVRQLLAYMTTRPAASRQRVATALWPDLDLEDGLRNLRVTLNYAQRVLEPDRADGDPPFFLRAEGGMLSLRTDEWLTVDVWTFDRLLDEAAALDRQGVPSMALDKYRQATALFRDDFMFDAADADWAVEHTERVRTRYVAAAVRAGELLVAVGGHDEARALAYGVLQVERWSESAYQLLIVVHLERDELDAARMAYQQCLRMLAELGTRPSPKMALLEHRLWIDRAAVAAHRSGHSPAVPSRP